MDRVREIVDRFGLRVFNLCRRMLGNAHDAEDVTQQVFATLCADPSRLREVLDVEGWILTVAANACRNLIRTRGREVSLELLPEADAAASFAEAPPERLAAAIAGLPETYRLAVLYRYQQDLDVDRIAELMGTTPGNVRVILHRALGALRLKVRPDSV